MKINYPPKTRYDRICPACGKSRPKNPVLSWGSALLATANDHCWLQEKVCREHQKTRKARVWVEGPFDKDFENTLKLISV